MKVLQVNCHYNYGSTGKIMCDISHFLKEEGVESIMCYARGTKVHVPNVFRIANEYISKVGKLFNKLYGRPLKWGRYATKNFIKIIESERPDIVHLHCINAYTMNVYQALEYLKKTRIPTLITLHAEFMHTGGCSYSFECNQWKDIEGCKKCPPLRSSFVGARNCKGNWKLMYDAFQGFDKNKLLLASVSPWLMNRAKESTILASYNHKAVLNGIDTRIFRCYNNDDIKLARKKYGIMSEYVIIHVTSDFNAGIKGGKYVLEFDEKLSRLHDKDYEIIVVGPAVGQESTNRIKFLGIIRDQKELATLYSLSNMTLLTSEKETFSMICAESLCCGTPIVGFRAGAPETISMPEFSCFCDFSDTDSLVESAIQTMETKYSKEDVSDSAIKIYSSQRMGYNYLALYEKLLIEKNG